MRQIVKPLPPAPIWRVATINPVSVRFLNSERVAVQVAQLAAIVLGGLLIRIALIQTAGYHDDIVIFYDWFRSIALLPPADVYAHTPGLNYPPMSVVLYELEALVLRAFVHGSPNTYALNIVVKSPAILMDCAGAVLIYSIIRRHASHPLALLGATLIALNPTVIYDSAFWGQNDAVPTILALFALSQLLFGNTVVAWLSITAAILFKPPVLVLVPLMLLHPFTVVGAARLHRLRQTAVGVVSAFVLAEAIALMFFDHPTPFAAARHLVGQMISGSGLFPFNSLNAFNVWCVMQPFFVSDKLKFLSLSQHMWGDVLFIIVAAAIYYQYARSRHTLVLLEAATLVLLAFFLLLTEMHERYLYYAVIFCVALVLNKTYRIPAIVLSVTLLVNMEYGLTFMYLDDARATMVDRYEFAPCLVRICALTNLSVFLYLLRAFFKASPAIKTCKRLPARTDFAEV